MSEPALYGAIELGGTKIVLAVGHSDGQILRRTTVPTAHPDQVMPEILGFFRDCGDTIVQVGVGAFGPIVIDPAASDYGKLLRTNKPGWSDFDLVGTLERGMQVA